MIRNIIWDLDGTLFDTYPAISKAFKAALNDFGKDAPLDWIEELAKVSLSHCVKTLADKYQLDEDRLGNAFGDHYDFMKPEEQPLFPEVITICQYIYSIGGKNVIVTHRGQKGTIKLLSANHLADYFAGYITGNDDYPRKPDPAAFEAIIKLHNLNKEETITVGDRDIDILAGKAAGVFTCLFGVKIDGLSADLTVSNFDELYRYVVSSSQ
jgi:phosphoglycolate phosphatase-like HAD superfamily hydrolase